MKFKCLFFFYSAVICLVNGVRILNVGRNVDIAAGSELELQCTNNASLQWSFPTQSNEDKVEILEHNLIDEYHSNLKISNIQFTDTGYYYCSDRNQKSFIESVYVFVNDENHLFVSENPSIRVHHNTQFFIPCRPTFSQATVTLWKGDELVAIDENVTFDNKKGFTIKKSNSYFSGFFYCKTEYGNKIEKLTFDLVYDDSSIQPPRINASGIIEVTKNSSLKLICKGKYETYWKMSSISFSNGHIFNWKITKSANETSAELENAIGMDSGPIMCCYKNYDCEPTKTASSVFIRVKEPDVLYLQEVDIIVTRELQCVPFVIQCIPSMPGVKVRLRLPNGVQDNRSTLKEDFSYYPTLGFIPNDFKRILGRYTSGEFVCEFRYEDIKQSVPRSIFILKPRFNLEISISNNNPYEGDHVEIVCEACKFAFEDLTWEWNSNIENSASAMNVHSSTDGEIDESTTYTFKKVFRISSASHQNNGKYECVGRVQGFVHRKSIDLEIKARDFHGDNSIHDYHL